MHQNLIQTLKAGGVAVIATDTLYGIVASAHNRAAVERVYELKGRTPTKPFIILIAEVSDLATFKIHIDQFTATLISKYWPGPLSVIMPCPVPEYEYLHRGTQTLAFRLPDSESLCELIRQTGPLIAPSANPEGLPPATTIEEARAYFSSKSKGGDEILYEDVGTVNNPPSTLIEIKDGRVVVLRQGAVKM